ncbi:Peptidase M20 domain-containing protein [Escovopsis weberi]|uniref:Peptidase M20 domain-containing protein n=1 Tax=Escovopsis weberi TaxID=150374 RepID=A0A0M8N1E1_ESCWE|nr:Peptidase M20 domain-containing protein [Escovopsis weberi]
MHWANLVALIASSPFALASRDVQSRLVPAAHPANPIPDHAALDAPPYRAELLKLLQSLVSIPSAEETENRIGLFLADYLRGEGYGVELQPVPAQDEHPDVAPRYNVLAWRGERRPARKVLVTSHIDVVPPQIPWHMPDGEVVTRATVISGRGTADAKGSVAAMILAAKQLRESGALGGGGNGGEEDDDVMLLFVVGEETRGDGMAAFSASLDALSPRPQFGSVIFGEPTENKLACGHKGGLFCSLWAAGKAGHSGYPELGKSANELMVRAWAKILDADLGSSELFGNTTINIGRFDGGVAANVIPASAFVGFATRVASGSEKEGHIEVRRKIEAILDEVDREAFTLECGHGYGPYMCDCDVEGFGTIVANYGTDIPNLGGNHTRYLYGPGSILVAHGDGEQVTVGDLETAVEDFQKLILHALKQ